MKHSATQHIAIGTVVAIIGVLLVKFAGDVSMPVITPSKLGAVLIVLGVIELLYGTWLRIVKSRD